MQFNTHHDASTALQCISGSEIICYQRCTHEIQKTKCQNLKKVIKCEVFHIFLLRCSFGIVVISLTHATRYCCEGEHVENFKCKWMFLFLLLCCSFFTIVFIFKCFTPENFISCVSFKRYFWFFNELMNLNKKKMHIAIRNFRIYFNVMLTVRGLLFYIIMTARSSNVNN